MTNYKIYLTNDANVDTIHMKAHGYEVKENTTEFYVNTYNAKGKVVDTDVVLEVFNKHIVYIQKM